MVLLNVESEAIDLRTTTTTATIDRPPVDPSTIIIQLLPPTPTRTLILTAADPTRIIPLRTLPSLRGGII